jgi:hypothetical protein
VTINTGKKLVWNLTSPRSRLWLALKRGPLEGMPFEQLADGLPELQRQAVSNTLNQMAGLGVINKPARRGGLFNLNPVGPVPEFITGGEDPTPAADEPPPPSPGAALQSWFSPGVDLGPKRPLRTAAEECAEQPAPMAAPAPAPETDRKITPAPGQTLNDATVAVFRAHLERNPPASLGLRTRRTGPAAEAPAPGPQLGDRIGMAPLTFQGETVNDLPESGFLCALFSNGKLQLQVHDQRVTLSLEHTRALLHYLDHMDASHLTFALAQKQQGAGAPCA